MAEPTASESAIIHFDLHTKRGRPQKSRSAFARFPFHSFGLFSFLDVESSQVRVDHHLDAVMTEGLGYLCAELCFVAVHCLPLVSWMGERLLELALVDESVTVSCIDIFLSISVFLQLCIQSVCVFRSLKMRVAVSIANVDQSAVLSALAQPGIDIVCHPLALVRQNQGVSLASTFFTEAESNHCCLV